MEKQAKLIGDLLFFKNEDRFPILDWTNYQNIYEDGEKDQHSFKSCYSIERVRDEKKAHDSLGS
jgi:hypothetical protein